MTPLMRRVYLSGGRLGYENADILTDFLCFDVTEVQVLARETIKTFDAQTYYDLQRKPATHHGGLMVMPHDYTWLEWRMSAPELGSERVGSALVLDEELGTIYYSVVSETMLDRPARVPMGMIRLLPNEEFRIEISTRDNYDDDDMIAIATRAGFLCSAFLLILNAPYGIRKDSVPIHRGHAREARRKNVALKPHTIVYLDKTRAPPPEANGTPRDGPAFHKGFHFVRTHLRHFQDGSHTRVKAHWRGDPRLGICKIPDYRVRP